MSKINIKPIRTEADYEWALQEIESLWDSQSNSDKEDRFEILVTLVEAYEEKHHPIPPPDPIDAILYEMECRGWTRQDLEPYLGSRARVSEILNRKRPLSLNMIRRLQDALSISADVLIQQYPLAA